MDIKELLKNFEDSAPEVNAEKLAKEIENKKDAEAVVKPCEKKFYKRVDKKIELDKPEKKVTNQVEESLNEEWVATGSYMELDIPTEVIDDICHSGSNDEAVATACAGPLREQLDSFTDEEIDKAFREIGFDKSEEEINAMTRQEKEHYLVWDLAWDAFDRRGMEESFEDRIEAVGKARHKEATKAADAYGKALDKFTKRHGLTRKDVRHGELTDTQKKDYDANVEPYGRILDLTAQKAARHDELSLNRFARSPIGKLLTKYESICEGAEFNYMLLDRLRTDCEYFLGNGNGYEKHLWAGNVKDQIAKMRELYNKVEEKPEWISMEDIDNYEKQMLAKLEEKKASVKEAAEDLTWEQVEPQVKEAVEAYKKEYAYLFKDGAFELYADYNDRLQESTIKEIFEADKPSEAFYDIIGGWDWFENADIEYDSIFEHLKLDNDIKEGFRDEIMEYLRDNVSYSIPYDHFDETVGFDVFLHDADSANREYYDMLEFVETDEQDEDGDYIKKLDNINGMLEKFLKSQGYTKEQFIEYYNEDKSGDKFLDSLLVEIENTNHGDGRGCQIVFLVQAPILEMAAAIEDGGTITIPQNAMCGLSETFNGSGGPLEIKLKQAVTGTIKEAGKAGYQAGGDFEVQYKHGYSYNLDDIYGLVSSAWDAKVTFAKQEPVSESTDMVYELENKEGRKIWSHTKRMKGYKWTGKSAENTSEWNAKGDVPITEEAENVLSVKFVRVDDWNRPIFKVEGKKYYLSDTGNLFDYGAKEEEIKEFYKDKNLRDLLTFHGYCIDCEPSGGRLKYDLKLV